MLLVDLIYSRLGPFIGVLLVKTLSRESAYRVSDWIVQSLVKRRNSDLYRSVRANQAVIRDWPYEDERLHLIVQEVLSNAAYGLVDWFRTIAFASELTELPCTIDEDLLEDVYRSLAEDRGIVVVGAHLSSFNLFFMMIGQRNWPVQILSHHVEQGSYQTDNILRKKFGLNVTPISAGSLRKAYQRLESGGCVLTGVDRPDTGGEPLTFFGRTATLPIGHARLAIQTGARVKVLAVQKVKPGKYHVIGSRLIEPEQSGDSQRDARKLAQQVIHQLEEYIRERPSEWMMFIPVWPEMLPKWS